MLEKINSPADVKRCPEKELNTLCAELREEILRSVAKNGGHLASNLGDVELTVAIHRVFDLPEDKLVFDVGHQSYAHKLLTGRKEGFGFLRSDGGVSGFTKRSESEYDPFGSGHSGNALSASIGLARALKMRGSEKSVVALLGDGSFTNGMTYEALNNCAGSDLRLVIVLNDNEMAISRNVGSINNVFTRLRTSKRYFNFKNRFVKVVSTVPLVGKPLVGGARRIKNFFKRLIFKENFFETLGFEYIGPVDGNDLKRLIPVLEQAKRRGSPCVIHTYTKKGKGYAFAEEKPDLYHSVPSFDPATGVVPNGKEKTFSYNAGAELCRLADEDGDIAAVTAAMTAGTGLAPFAEKHPDRFFDVGIAEEHAATFCAGLAAGGLKPVFAVYSTFLQRAFDQVAEDAAMQSLRLTLLVDRAGLVADDGVTHHGIFDAAMLNSIPSCLIYSPETLAELRTCIGESLAYDGVSAVRYPKGKEVEYDRSAFTDLGTLSYADYGEPKKAVVTYGRITSQAVLAARSAGDTRVIKLLRVKPLDIDTLLRLLPASTPAVFAEEGVLCGGIGETLKAALGKENMRVLAIDGAFPGHGSYGKLFAECGIDAAAIEKALASL